MCSYVDVSGLMSKPSNILAKVLTSQAQVLNFFGSKDALVLLPAHIGGLSAIATEANTII